MVFWFGRVPYAVVPRRGGGWSVPLDLRRGGVIFRVNGLVRAGEVELSNVEVERAHYGSAPANHTKVDF